MGFEPGFDILLAVLAIGGLFLLPKGSWDGETPRKRGATRNSNKGN